MRHPGKVYGNSKGRAPGSKQYYRKVYSASRWDEFLRAHSTGSLLQVCTGGSFLGSVRVDKDPEAPAVNVRADMLKLPFLDRSFDTVACDPIYGIDFRSRVLLQRELSRVARQRIIFKAPWIPRAAGWSLQDNLSTAILSHTCANISMLSILDRRPETKALALQGFR